MTAPSNGRPLRATARPVTRPADEGDIVNTTPAASLPAATATSAALATAGEAGKNLGAYPMGRSGDDPESTPSIDADTTYSPGCSPWNRYSPRSLVSATVAFVRSAVSRPSTKRS